MNGGFRASTRFFLGNRDYEYGFEAIHVEDQEDEVCPYEYTGLVYVDEDFIWNRFIESDLTKDKIFSRTQQQYLWSIVKTNWRSWMGKTPPVKTITFRVREQVQHGCAIIRSTSFWGPIPHETYDGVPPG